MGVAVPLIWGMGFVFAKAAIEHFPPILLMSLRFTVTALTIIWIAGPLSGQWRQVFWIAIVSAAIQYSLTFTGLRYLDASIAVLVVQLEVPFLVLVGAVLLGESPGWRKWLGMAMAFGGVLLIAGEPRLAGAWVALVMVAAGAFTWALGQAMVRRLQGFNGVTTTAWVAVFAAPQLLIMSLTFEEGHVEAIRTAGPVVWGAVVYLGVVMTAGGYAMWYSLVRRHPVGRVAPFLLLLPLFSVLGSAIFLGERLTWMTAAGGTVVLAGLTVIMFDRDQDDA